MAVTKKIQNSSISGTALKDKPQGWEFGPGDKKRKLSDAEVAKVVKEADEVLSAAAEGIKPAKKPSRPGGKRALANAFSKELITQKFSGKPDPEKLAGIVAQIRGLPDGKPTQAELDLVKTTMTDSGITLDDALDTLADSLQAGFDKAMDAIRDDPPIHASDMAKVYSDFKEEIAVVDARVDQLVSWRKKDKASLEEALENAGESLNHLQDAGLVCIEEVHEVVDEKIKPVADALSDLNGRLDGVNLNLRRLDDAVMKLREGEGSRAAGIETRLSKLSVDYEDIHALDRRVMALENLYADLAKRPVADKIDSAAINDMFSKNPWTTPRPSFTNVEAEREDARDAEDALELAFEIKRLHQEIDSYTRTRQDIVDNDEQFASLNGKRLIAACDQKISEMRAEIEELRGEFDQMVGGDIDIDADGLYPADENRYEVDLRAGPNGPRQLTKSEQRDILVNKLMGHAVYWSIHPKIEEETEAEHRYRICAGTVASVLGELDGDGTYGSGYLVIPNTVAGSASRSMGTNENYTAYIPSIHENHQLNNIDISGGLQERALEMTRSFRSTFRRKLTNKA